MTPTLENAYGATIKLHVMDYALTGSVFSRQILLFAEGYEKPVVFGAIKIYLDRLPEQTRELVVERKLPFGTILRKQQIAHRSRPSAFFKVRADEVINNALGLTGASLLYGRRNILSDLETRTLAQVIEILPPQP